MNEGEIIKDFEQIPQERIKALKKAAKRVQKLGIDDWAQRRELVIDAESIAVEEKERRKKEQKQEIKEEDKGTKEAAEKEAQPVKRENIYELNDEELASIDSVAQAAIDQESDLTKETAINKYLEVKRGTLSDVIVDAVHTFRPRPIDVFQLLKDKITGLTYEQVKQALEKIESGQSLEGVDKRLIKAFDLFDEETGELADRVVELSGASCIKAKKPRTFADLNRNWFKRATQKIGEVTTFAREFSRSVRAAYYWALRNIVIGQENLDMKGHITRPFLRLALHGMVNRKAGDFDFAIAGARNVADERILEWFEKQLTEKINSQSELVVDSGQKPKVVIAIPEDDKTKAFAGRNIGLATLRMETRGHIIQHPNFGPGFSTIQLEISNRIRTDKSKREILANILAEILRKFPNEFPQL